MLKYSNSVYHSKLFVNIDIKTADEYIDLMCGEIKTYKKSEMIHFAYTAMGRFGLVISGRVLVCCDDIDGNRIIMAEVKEGKTFGESLCFLKLQDSPVYIYSYEESEILWLSLESLYNKSMDIKIIDLQKRFTALLAQRTLEMNNRIQILSKMSIKEKIIMYLSELSFENKTNIFNVPLNRNDMAAYIGTNRSALSRELSKMKKEGIIDYHKQYFKIISKNNSK